MEKILRINPYPKAYDAPWVKMDYRCIEEIEEIVKESGLRERFNAHFYRRHDYIKDHWEKVKFHKQWFELLSNGAGLYSLHIADVDNLRILFVFHGSEVWHLCAFKEKGKRQSYERYIPIAQSRLEEILEEEEDG